MAAKRQRFAARRKMVGLSQEQLADRLQVERSTVGRWERNETDPQPWMRPKIARELGLSEDDLDALFVPDLVAGKHDVWNSRPGVVVPELPRDGDEIELLRLGINDALTGGNASAANLDDWEMTVARYGRATRDRPATLLLEDLTTDIGELAHVLSRYRSASALRRLARVMAQMSGLVCLTLCKLDDRPAFRRWARTARLAATEADDAETHSWILAQEAYGHYYSGDFLEAVDVAQHAQALVSKTPCVGAALAAALEARAQAVMGERRETQLALARAESALSHLTSETQIPSAFGYNEAQLRFHEGNAYTHLTQNRNASGEPSLIDAKRALHASDRALELCPERDYTDWAMTRLDRASCLALTDDRVTALNYAIETLSGLTESQRTGIITLRGHRLLRELSHQHQAPQVAHNLRELLIETSEKKELEKP